MTTRHVAEESAVRRMLDDAFVGRAPQPLATGGMAPVLGQTHG